MRDRLDAELSALDREAMRRRLRAFEGETSTCAVIDGREAIVFAGNDYLGLARHPEVVRAATLALERYGASATASRLVSGDSPAYRRLEGALARLKQREAALVFPTGYHANLGVLGTLVGRADGVYLDKLDHASIYDGVALSGATLRRYPHVDLARLEEMLEIGDEARRRFIVTDGVFSMDGDLAPLPRLRELADEYGCLLVVDDAHGTGVVGNGGAGTCAALGAHADIEIGTLSKALGSVGGFVACDAVVADYLVNKARPFIFTTGLPPASIAAATRAVELLAEEPWRQTRVLDLAGRVRSRLTAAGFRIPDGVTPIVPIVVGDASTAVRLSEACLAEGVFVPAIRPPSVPPGTARLRLTLSAAHTGDEVEHALTVLTSVGREWGIGG